MTRIARRMVPIFAAVLSACAAAPEPAPPAAAPAPPAAAPDEAGARRAVEISLASLSRRNFEVTDCVAAGARVVGEAVARAGAPIGERCTLLVARRADQTWLVVIRPATLAAPTRAGGSQAVVTVTAGGEGVAHIDYVR